MRWIRNELRRLSTRGLRCGAHITRYSMYNKLAQFSHLLEGRETALSISNSNHLLDVMGAKGIRVTEAKYPEHNILDLSFKDDTFDIVVSDQVLEHVEGCPKTAFDESLRVLRKGGVAVHTSCLMNPIHNYPGDFWRFTPDALLVLARGSAEVVECGGWGNYRAWALIRDGFRFDPIPDARWHPLNRIATQNEDDWPIVTWIILRK